MKNFSKFLVICITSILLIEAGIVSTSWAGKPSQPVILTNYGYAKLDDSMAIRSDGIDKNNDGIIDQYADCSKGGKDFIQVNYPQNPNDGAYLKIRVVIGKMAYFPNTSIISDRYIKLCFDVLGNPIAENLAGNEAIYNILKQYKNGNSYVDRSNNIGYIDDNSVRAEIFTSVSGGGGVINFLVDPSPNADCSDSKAINDTRINTFYDWDAPNLNYTDTTENGEGGQTFYRLNYVNGFDVVRNGLTWTITPKPSEVKLSVQKYKSLNSSGASRIIYLATYASVPFKLTVSLDPLQAPRKHETVSTTWGDIRAINR